MPDLACNSQTVNMSAAFTHSLEGLVRALAMRGLSGHTHTFADPSASTNLYHDTQ